jgi:hypothetical protein
MLNTRKKQCALQPKLPALLRSFDTFSAPEQTNGGNAAGSNPQAQKRPRQTGNITKGKRAPK